MIYPHVRYLGPAHPDHSEAERWAGRELDGRSAGEVRIRAVAGEPRHVVSDIGAVAGACALPFTPGELSNPRIHSRRSR